MEKIVFRKIPKSYREKTSQQIRVSVEVYKQLTKICDETGLTLCAVTSRIFKAALPFVELQKSPFEAEESEEDPE